MNQQCTPAKSFCGLSRPNASKCHKWFIKLWIDNDEILVENPTSMLPASILICYMRKEPWHKKYGIHPVDSQQSSLWINFQGGGKAQYMELNHYIEINGSYNNNQAHTARIQILNEKEICDEQLNISSSSMSDSMESMSHNAQDDRFDRKIMPPTPSDLNNGTDQEDILAQLYNKNDHYQPVDGQQAQKTRNRKRQMAGIMNKVTNKKDSLFPSSQDSSQEIITNKQNFYEQTIKSLKSKCKDATNRYAPNMLFYCENESFGDGFEKFIEFVNEIHLEGAQRRSKQLNGSNKISSYKVINCIKNNERYKNYLFKDFGITKHFLTQQPKQVQYNPLYQLLNLVKSLNKKRKTKQGVHFTNASLDQWKDLFKDAYKKSSELRKYKLGKLLFYNIIQIAINPIENGSKELVPVAFGTAFSKLPSKLIQILRILYCHTSFFTDFQKNHKGTQELKYQLHTPATWQKFDCIPRAYILIIHEMLFKHPDFSDTFRKQIIDKSHKEQLFTSWRSVIEHIFKQVTWEDEQEQQIWSDCIKDWPNILKQNQVSLGSPPDLNCNNFIQLAKKDDNKGYNLRNTKGVKRRLDDEDNSDDDNNNNKGSTHQPSTKKRKTMTNTSTTNKKKTRINKKKGFVFNETSIKQTISNTNTQKISKTNHSQFFHLINKASIFNLLSIIGHKCLHQKNDTYIETLPIQLANHFQNAPDSFYDTHNFYKIIQWFVEGVPNHNPGGNHNKRNSKLTNSIHQSIQSIIQNASEKQQKNNNNKVKDFKFGIIIPMTHNGSDSSLSSIQYALYVYNVTNIETKNQRTTYRRKVKSPTNVATYSVKLDADNIECAVWSVDKTSMFTDVFDKPWFVPITRMIMIGKCIEHYINNKFSSNMKQKKTNQSAFLKAWKLFNNDIDDTKHFYCEEHQKTPLSAYLYLDKCMSDYINDDDDDDSLINLLKREEFPNYDKIYTEWLSCLTTYNKKFAVASGTEFIDFSTVNQGSYGSSSVFSDYVRNGIDVKLAKDLQFWTHGCQNISKDIIPKIADNQNSNASTDDFMNQIDNSIHELNEEDSTNDVDMTNKNENIEPQIEISGDDDDSFNSDEDESNIQKNNDKKISENEWEELKESFTKFRTEDDKNNNKINLPHQICWKSSMKDFNEYQESKTSIWGYLYDQYINHHNKLKSLAIEFDVKPTTITEFRAMYQIIHDLGTFFNNDLACASDQMLTLMENLNHYKDKDKYPDLLNHLKEEQGGKKKKSVINHTKCLFCNKSDDLHEHNAFNFKKIYNKLQDDEMKNNLKDKVSDLYKALTTLRQLNTIKDRFDLASDSFIHWPCLFNEMKIIIDKSKTVCFLNAKDDEPYFVSKKRIHDLCEIIMQIWETNNADYCFAASNVIQDNYNISTYVEHSDKHNITKHEWIGSDTDDDDDDDDKKQITFRLFWHWEDL